MQSALLLELVLLFEEVDLLEFEGVPAQHITSKLVSFVELYPTLHYQYWLQGHLIGCFESTNASISNSFGCRV